MIKILFSSRRRWAGFARLHFRSLREIGQFGHYSFSRPPLMLPPETESRTEFTNAVVSPAIGAMAPFSLISAFS